MFAEQFLTHCQEIVERLDRQAIEDAAKILRDLRDREGRLFVIGSGGGAGHASHATSDFRKICNIEAYAPYDNVSELTARVNDNGWESTIKDWLSVSRFCSRDGLFIFSVGGGSLQNQISLNLVNAMKEAKDKGASIVAVVGRDGGFASEIADSAIIIPEVDRRLVTPLTEGFQAIIWHLLVSHPVLQINAAKWESITPRQQHT